MLALAFCGCAGGALAPPEPSTTLFTVADQVTVPAGALSFTLDVQPQSTGDLSTVVGVTTLTDPAGRVVYRTPADDAAYYAAALRYRPAEGGSTLRVPLGPHLPLSAGVYRFAVEPAGARVTATVRQSQLPVTRAHLPLRFHITDLSSACRPLTVADLQNDALAAVLAESGRVLAQAGISLGPVTFTASSAAPTLPSAVTLPDLALDALLAANTTSTESDGVDIVVLAALTDSFGHPDGVTGEAGAIPAATFGGTAHSGALLTVESLCATGNNLSPDVVLGRILAHELGHALGLFHTVERTGQHDPLDDTAADPADNLMYWVVGTGDLLTAEQTAVMLADPKLR